MEGWITLHRKFLSWEWFNKPEMVQLFIWLLLNANYADKKWQGIVVKRGQILTTTPKIMEALRLSERQTRTCISRLKSTGEVTVETTNRFTIITICNYDKYQSENFVSDGQNDGQSVTQATDERRTNDGHNITNNITNKQLIINNNNNNTCVREERDKVFEIFFFKNFIAPEIEVQRFYDHYEASGWCRANGIEIEDRLALARLWKQKDAKQRFPQLFLDALQEVCMEIDDQQITTVLRGIDKLDRVDGSIKVCCNSRSSAEILAQYNTIIAERMGSATSIALKRVN